MPTEPTLTRATVLDAARRLRDAAALLEQTQEPDEALEVAARAEKVAADLRGGLRRVEWLGL